MHEYWQGELHALSLNEMCRRIRISKPAVYREFGGEDGLMEAALILYRTQVLDLMRAALVTDLPFATMSERLIVALSSTGAGPAGCLFTKMRINRDRVGERTQARLDAMAQDRYAIFEGWFRRALERDEVRASVKPTLAARYLDTQCTALLRQVGAGEAPELVRAQARLAFRALLACPA
ncbi:MAG: AcrR family transcriptional regulator [Bradymonadia bacterium]|jgi:AcrR family transcriptional regulator